MMGLLGILFVFYVGVFLKFFASGNWSVVILFCLSERVTTGVCWSMIWYLVLNEGKNYLGMRNQGSECEWPRFY